MVERTPNHELNKYSQGETDWTHSPDMQTIEERLVVRDTDANKSEYTPHDGATFIATDTGAVYDGEGGSWTLATRQFDDVSTEDHHVQDKSMFGTSLDDFAAGRSMGGRWVSWPNKTVERFSMLPVNRDRPVVIFSSEGSQKSELNEAFPRFRARKLPWMFALTPGRIGDSGALTEAEAKEILQHGAETGLYTGAGAPVDDGGDLISAIDSMEDLERIIVQQKRDLEERGFKVQTLMPRNQNGIDQQTIDSPQSYAIRSEFAVTGHSRIASREETLKFGPALETEVVEDPTSRSTEAVEAMLDRLVERRGDILWLFFHSEFVTNNGNWDHIEQILDKAQSLRDAGEIDVRTPFGSQIPYDREDMNLASEPSPKFESFGDSFWATYGGDPEVRSYPDDPYWAIGGDSTDGALSGLRAFRTPFPAHFPAAMVQFDAKAPDGEQGTVATQFDGFTSIDTIARHTTEVGDSWETVFAPFAFPRADIGAPKSSDPYVAIWAGSSEVHVKNVKIYPT